MADPVSEQKQAELAALMGSNIPSSIDFHYGKGRAGIDAASLARSGVEASGQAIVFPAIAGQNTAKTLDYLNQRYGMQFEDNSIFSLSQDGRRVTVSGKGIPKFVEIIAGNKEVSGLMLRDLGLDVEDRKNIPAKESNSAKQTQTDAAYVLGSYPSTQINDYWGGSLHRTDFGYSNIQSQDIVKQADGRLATTLPAALTAEEQKQIGLDEATIKGKSYLELKDGKTLIISSEALLGDYKEAIEEIYSVRAVCWR